MYQQNQYQQPPRQNSGYDQHTPTQQGSGQVAPFQRNNQQNPVSPQQRPQQAPMQNNAPMQQRPQQAPMQNNGQATQGYGQQNRQPAPAHSAPMNHAPAPMQQHRQRQQKIDDKAKLDRPEWFLQLNTFGGKCAFQVETSMTKNGWHTVNIESAKREDPDDPENKRYLWNDKTVLQMTQSELPIFAAVMLGFLSSARFDNHQTKFLEIENQGKNFFIKSGGQNKNLHVAPMPTVEAYMYGTMALTQYCRNFNGLSTEAGLQIIRGLARQLGECGGHKQVKPR